MLPSVPFKLLWMYDSFCIQFVHYFLDELHAPLNLLFILTQSHIVFTRMPMLIRVNLLAFQLGRFRWIDVLNSN